MWHCGQMLRGGALSTQALARRLRLLALEVFYLATAMWGRLPVLPVSRVNQAGAGATPASGAWQLYSIDGRDLRHGG